MLLTLGSGVYLWIVASGISKEIQELLSAIGEPDEVRAETNRRGLDLATLDRFRQNCEHLVGAPKQWWEQIDSHIETYTSREDVEGWFLTCRPKEAIPY